MTIDENFWTGAAVVTGAGSGLGEAMARRFAGVGMAVTALDIDAARAEDTAKSIRADGGRAISMSVDVADRAALDKAAQATEEAFGACNVLCANVGVQQFGSIDRLTEAEWRWILDVNVLGCVNTVAAFLPLMRKSQGNRRIAVTASSSVLVPGVRLGAYIASKYAVMGYGETLRMELAPEEIGVSVVIPAGMSSRHVESSQLAKPAEIGGVVMSQEDMEFMMASRNMDGQAHVVTPEFATRHLLTELAADRRFIVSHGYYRDELVERNDDLLAAFDRAQN
jgi:NAD(P)-dependent dehydrogenase (short-subunit alcohol dehydrogenase family)